MEKGRSVCTAGRVGSQDFRKTHSFFTDYKTTSHWTFS